MCWHHDRLKGAVIGDTAYEFCIDVGGCPVGETLFRRGLPDVHFPQLAGIGEQNPMKWYGSNASATEFLRRNK
jgi:hypothetical protein